MTTLAAIATIAVLITAAICVFVWARVREIGLDRWVPSYIFPAERISTVDLADDQVDVFIAICDHYEPEWGNPSVETALSRVQRWHDEYPRLFEKFTDVDGRPPRHTFFYPQDQYRPEYPVTNEIVYGFIHGNWCLCNSRRDGHWCGVDHEIPVLLKTGCYADFTMPSAPSDTQTTTINSIYYAQDLPGQRKSHDRGIRAAVGRPAPDNSLLMVQGPLAFDWSRKKFGVLPKIENGDLLANHPPTIERMPLWMNAGITVQGRPNWRFVKLHTHGCKSGNIDMLLGTQAQRFHQDLAALHQAHPNFRYHYVSAWEMAQLIHQAEQAATEPVIPHVRRHTSTLAHLESQ
jgi:hypothetical protein